MGQRVEIKDVVAMGEVMIIDTDRSFTGQDGQTISPGKLGSGTPGLLAARLYALGLGIDHVHVQQNSVTVRRPGGWDPETRDLVVAVAGSFLRFYDEEE
ncbi:MAG TPA: hypothetical protein VGA97_00570 [Acidimicrobiia bacterium]